MIRLLYDWLIGIIVNPVETLQDISKKEPISQAILVSLFAYFISSLSMTASRTEIFTNQALSVVSSFVASAAGLIILFLSTLLLFLISKIFSSKGSYWGLFSALGFSNFILVFNPFTSLLQNVLGRGHIIPVVIGLLLFIWQLVLTVISINESQGLSVLNSILTIVLSLIALAFIGLLIVLILGLLFTFSYGFIF